MTNLILNRIRKGFSSIELLLIIGISALIAGIFIFSANAPQQTADVTTTTATVAELPGRTAGTFAQSTVCQLYGSAWGTGQTNFTPCTEECIWGYGFTYENRCVEPTGYCEGFYLSYSSEWAAVCDVANGDDDCSFISNDGGSCLEIVCGDERITGQEECDDGANNGTPGFCNSTCDGYIPVCGDSIQTGDEECDDGNTTDDGNGCDAICQRNDVCGDGIHQELYEECEDGNTTSWDGCSSTCLIDPVCDDAVFDRTDNTWTVSPSTNPVDPDKAEEDWTNIYCALIEVANTPGRRPIELIVQLDPGLFYLHRSISVRDFNGTFKGGGKEGAPTGTTIETAPGMDFDISASKLFPEGGGGGIMLEFLYSPRDKSPKEITIANLRVHATEKGTGFDYLWWGTPDLKALGPIKVANSLEGTDEDYSNIANAVTLDVSMESVSVEGRRDLATNWWAPGLNVYRAISIWGPIIGNATLKDSYVKNAADGFVPAYVLEGESTTRDSIFEDNIWPVIYYQNPTGSGIIENNTFSGSDDVGIFLINAANITVEGNTISMPTEGILGRPGGHLWSDNSPNVVFRNNYMVGDSEWGVVNYGSSHNWTITGNKFGARPDPDNPGQLIVEGMSSDFGAISVQGDNSQVYGNEFYDINADLGAVWVDGQGNTVGANDYTESGLLGWSVSATGTVQSGSVLLDVGTSGNTVNETNFPTLPNGTPTTVCTQVADLTLGANTVTGAGVCDSNAYNHLMNMIRQYANLRELGADLGFPGGNWPTN